MGQELIKLKQIEPITANDIPIEVRDKHYVHEQRTANTVWRVKHNLGKMPSVECWGNGNRMHGQIVPVEGDELNKLDIIFCVATKGVATCN